MNKICAEVWVMRQFFCRDKAEAIAKVTEWMDKAEKIEVIPE